MNEVPLGQQYSPSDKAGPPPYAQPMATYPNQPIPGQNYSSPTNVTQQYGAPQMPPVYVTQTTVTTNKEPSGLRTAIPALPMVLAIILCVVNFLIPGLGTIIAGFSVLCCGNVGQSGGGRFGTFCINFWVGLAQMLLIIFLIGWIWSIVWGLAFIAISAEADKKVATTTTTTTMTNTGVPQPIPVATNTTMQTHNIPV